jgi:tRNA (guanine37-N1)-methyltransferase
MDRETIARTWFSRDPLLHADMTEALRRGLGVIASAAERGVLVSADEDSCGMLSCADLDTALTLLDGRRFPLLSIHQAELESPLCRELGMETWMRCRQAVYLGKEPPAATEEDIRPLTGEHLDFLQANYRHEDSEYLAWLLERRALFGAFREEKLVGFIGKHAEGSMGLLEVLPSFRRQGVGESLERFLIAREVERGNLPYCHVFTDNHVSLALQRKLGLTLAEGSVIWLKEKRN